MAQNSLRDKNPILIVKEITDSYLRKNFDSLRQYFNANNQLYGFKYFDLTFTEAVTNQRTNHGLPTNPQDIVVTNIVGDGNVTFNKGLFDSTQIDITTTGACRISFFLGTYWDRDTPAVPQSADTQTFSPNSPDAVIPVDDTTTTAINAAVAKATKKYITSYGINGLASYPVNFPITATTKLADNCGLWDGTQFKAFENGIYKFTANLFFSMPAGGAWNMAVYKNGSVFRGISFYANGPAGGSNQTGCGSIILELKKDEYVSLVATNVASGLTSFNAGDWGNISVESLALTG